jgi:hypothetical protein
MSDIKEILQNIGYQNLKDFGGWYRTRPIYRSSDNDTVLAINKNTGYWYDYKLCRGGKLSELVQITLNLNDLDYADKMLAEKFNFTGIIVNQEKNTINQVKVYDESMLVSLEKNHGYWLNRGVKEEIVAEFKGGIAKKGNMINRYVFPIYNPSGKIVGFSGRSLVDSKRPDFIKWKHLGTKKEWVYPAFFSKNAISESGRVFLIESIGDMLALWQAGYKNVIVTFGLAISPKIIKFLLENSVQQVVVAFNNDSFNNSAGNEAAKKARSKLLMFFDENQVKIKLPPKKDFGLMGKNEIDLYMKEFNG